MICPLIGRIRTHPNGSLAWLNAPSSGPVPMALRKVTDTLHRINPAFTDVAMTCSKEQTLYLLATTNHWLQVGNKLSDAHFTLQDNGSIVLKHDALALDCEGGVTVVTVTRPLQ